MNDRLYSVEQVAERLGLHVRTIRNYVRDGRLTAVRIGKQYRIAHKDLEAFMGRPVNPSPDGRSERPHHAEASGIVHVDAISRETADRLTTMLSTAIAGRGPDDTPLRVETAYDEERARLRVIVLGGLGDTARLFDYMDAVLAT